MNDRLRWWVLPGAMIVLLGVLKLGTPESVPAAAVDAGDSRGTTAVLEASGRRLGEIVLPIGEAGAFVLSVPKVHAGAGGTMQIWRRTLQGREGTPWLTLQARVRSDATIPMAGLAAGRYDIELRFDDAVLMATDVAAPGTVVLVPPAAAPPR